ncbi:MAG: Ppx/GppA family phosphatase [Gammaproteobacteria bacterium]|uniref:Ppx/GppA family phosphatase n=2 Tax=Pseudomonas mandelii TaxID=75612 RepID=A0AB36CX11_9PSED|nr:MULTISPECIES: phosphatase [Pseudomonas]MBU0521459.1 Ppx/GppA family phosphatase [Gammaproteobacteria bacterium]MDF9881713.1 exopolyphosphatase/guanosine-5'-triphosphate,3'-diphosphate pyrophosphatase [Pseudomonas silensiensis]MBU0822394.1 Ppx/GppA family phosphatase [Gammaproteobacteria bacterium]MBU0841021.1 Ppx/GppA family phosphatase [Gammaproteobacteria bacterium]MBU1841890.1 Ppx/GppA family phosphatase [Gammaproteobacteria bacterium]
MKGNASLFAAIDLGSNAFRLMIGQSVRRNQQIVIQEVKTLREPVRLAEGFQGGALDELALDRGWQALARFGKKLRGFEAGRVRAVATSAVREADNAQLFLTSAERHLGFRIDVISGHEEARLVYAGVAHTTPSAASMRLVVDIGGGSTELILGQGAQPLLTESIAIGSSTFGTRYFHGGCITAQGLLEAERVATVQFEKVAHRYRALGWQQAIGSSGTARMLAKVLKANGLNDDDQGGITYGGLLRLSLRLLEAGQVNHLRLAGLQPHRLNSLPGGLVVMLAAFKVFCLSQMTPSEAGLRVGVLHGLMARH